MMKRVFLADHNGSYLQSDATMSSIMRVLGKMPGIKSCSLYAGIDCLALMSQEIRSYSELSGITINLYPYDSGDEWAIISDEYIFINGGA
jgi:hypothetical protein